MELSRERMKKWFNLSYYEKMEMDLKKNKKRYLTSTIDVYNGLKYPILKEIGIQRFFYIASVTLSFIFLFGIKSNKYDKKTKEVLFENFLKFSIGYTAPQVALYYYDSTTYLYLISQDEGQKFKTESIKKSNESFRNL